MKRTVSVAWVVAVIAAALLGPAPSARAGEANNHIGIRPLGFGINPDQYVFGFQAALGHVKIVRFAPSVDIGFGDNQTLTSINLDVLLDVFSPPKVRAGFYVGTGLGLHIISVDNVDDTDTEFGLNLLAGVKLPFGERHYYNLESRFGVGISEVPDFRLLLGVMFGFGDPD
jgi:hypothetical protein